MGTPESGRACDLSQPLKSAKAPSSAAISPAVENGGAALRALGRGEQAERMDAEAAKLRDGESS